MSDVIMGESHLLLSGKRAENNKWDHSATFACPAIALAKADVSAVNIKVRNGI